MLGHVRLAFWLWIAAAGSAAALDPAKQFTQYTHRVWTQADGLPQDTVRAIAQTRDGYLWAGTDEGLARFDGYRFVVYRKGERQLPGNAITALCAARDGSLWIGTNAGLASFNNGVFETYPGVPGSAITDIHQGPDGSIWVAAGLTLVRLRNGSATSYPAPSGKGFEGVRTVLPERDDVWVAGYGYTGRLEHDRIVATTRSGEMEGNIAISIGRLRSGELVVPGTEGLFVQTARGWTRYTAANGLPETFTRALLEDRDGNVWAGTNGGLARRQGNGFARVAVDRMHGDDWVWCIFEDRDGGIWVGTNSGLHQFLDQQFTVFTRAEGLPSDRPTAVFQDSGGRIWIGFHDAGVGRFEPGGFAPVAGLPSREVFAIRETRAGDLLVATRAGLSFVRNRKVVRTFVPSDPIGRRNVFDAVEDRDGRIWTATNQGLLQVSNLQPGANPVKGGTLLADAAVVLCAARDGGVWMGGYGSGLWYVRGAEIRHYTTAEGLPSDQIRSLAEDDSGTLWIGTFSGGLARLRQGKFATISTQHGLPSDNIARILIDRAGGMWLATTRGLARVAQAEVEAALSGRRHALNVTMYGIADGLRSAQCAPGYPIASGGAIASDGRLWFPTGFGVAVLDPSESPRHPLPSPPARIVSVVVDGVEKPAGSKLDLPADTRRVEIHYAAVELTSPSSLQYRVRLDRVDPGWVLTANRRVTEYNNLPYGTYRFTVAASLDRGSGYGQAATLELYREPHLYETYWFRALAILAAALAVWGGYRWRLGQVRRGYSLVIEERARLAREIHDTLAQGFVGITSQLDAVTAMMRHDPPNAERQLELARRMSQHSLTEARRSIMDLRAGALENGDLGAAIQEIARRVNTHGPVSVRVNLEPARLQLPVEAEQQLLRIAQEAIANAVKHSGASTINVDLGLDGRRLRLAVADNGRGFDPSDAFLISYGHFGLIGMRERAERLGGELKLDSAPGRGTTIEVFAPLP